MTRVWFYLMFLYLKCILGKDEVLMLTDIHYDHTYGSDLSVSCYDVKAEAGKDLPKFGDWLCDPPWELVVSAVDALKDVNPNPEFIIWTGDTFVHKIQYGDYWPWTSALVVEYMKNATELLRTRFPSTTVLPAIGNVDYVPWDQLPAKPDVVYSGLGDMWNTSGWLDTDEAQTTFRQAGFYTKFINAEKKVRAVVLNNVLVMSSNDVTDDMADPAGQVEWFRNTLRSAEQNGEKVYLIWHIPLGVCEIYEGGSDPLRHDVTLQLHDVIVQYSHIILYIVGGHEHYDFYRIFYKDGVPVQTSFTLPSVTPWQIPFVPLKDPDILNHLSPKHNPSVRALTVNSDLTPIDYTQYYTDLEEANKVGETVWKKHYTFTEEYGVEDMTPTTFQVLLERMKKDDDFFKRMYDIFLVGKQGECDQSCKAHHICSIEYIKIEEFQSCLRDYIGGSTGIHNQCTRFGFLRIATALFILLLSRPV